MPGDTEPWLLQRSPSHWTQRSDSARKRDLNHSLVSFIPFRQSFKASSTLSINLSSPGSFPQAGVYIHSC